MRGRGGGVGGGEEEDVCTSAGTEGDGRGSNLEEEEGEEGE